MSFPVLIVVAAVLNMIVGAVWYIPSVFGTKWMKSINMDPATISKSSMVKPMVTTFISYIVTGSVLAYVLPFGSAPLRDLLIMSTILWVGFVLSVRISHAMFERRSYTYVAITAGHDLVGLMVMTTVLSMVAVV